MKHPARAALTRGAVAILAVLPLAGCSPSPTADPGEAAGALAAWNVELPDGRSVVCVAATGYRSGVDCDWDNAS